MAFTTIRIKVIPIPEQINQKRECLIGLSLFLFTTQTSAQQGSQHQSRGPGVCAFLCGALQECHYLSYIWTLFIFSSVFNTVNRDMFLKLDIVSSSSEGHHQVYMSTSSDYTPKGWKLQPPQSHKILNIYVWKNYHKLQEMQLMILSLF